MTGFFDSLFSGPLGTPAARRSWLAGLRESIPKAATKNDLLDQIDGALFVPEPEGDPATLESLAKRYRGQVDKAGDLHDRVNKVARKGLPEVWVGDTSVRASDAVAAAARAATQMSQAFDGGAKALVTLADALERAKKQDADGRAKVADARRQLGGKDGFFDRMVETDEEKAELAAARTLAAAGVDLMHQGAVTADDAVRAAARDLNKWAAEARAGKLRTDDLTAVDRLMLADTSGAAGAADYNEILTANELARSGQAMEKLSAADRARMEQLLAGASSPAGEGVPDEGPRRGPRRERHRDVRQEDPRQGPGLAPGAPHADRHPGRQPQERGDRPEQRQQHQHRPAELPRPAVGPGRRRQRGHLCRLLHRHRPRHGRPRLRPLAHGRAQRAGERPRGLPAPPGGGAAPGAHGGQGRRQLERHGPEGQDGGPQQGGQPGHRHLLRAAGGPGRGRPAQRPARDREGGGGGQAGADRRRGVRRPGQAVRPRHDDRRPGG
ncbi:WXG100 family type VII secretion target [Streptomyces tricolor]|nr:WXG100 family type VII secretion target [Streptomyces tricolor]